MSIDYFAKKISLREGEEIIGILHHHPISYFKQILITAVLILISFFLMFYLFSLGYLGVAIFCALLLTGVFYGSREFYIWFSNVFIITNHRIIDIDQKGFFNKTVSEESYDKILDICYTVKGFWQTILKLGTIKIQATGASLILSNIKDVIRINQLLTDLILKNTGKEIEIKKVKQFTPKEKAQITQDFLNQEELDDYEEYNLNELIEEYKQTFGELKFKKILVDELEEYEEAEQQDEDDDQADEEEEGEEMENESALDEDIDELTSGKEAGQIQAKKILNGNFKKRKL